MQSQQLSRLSGYAQVRAMVGTLFAEADMPDLHLKGARVVLTTAGSQEEARRIGSELVERRLAACVNIVPQIESIYRWQDKVESATEWLLIIKTADCVFSQVRDAIQQLHSYEVPECIMLEIADGSQTYLKWIRENLQS
jgi:periplasmic divalent cation tolerance protein